MRDDPWFSGFVDGEGCFWISDSRSARQKNGQKLGYVVNGHAPVFSIQIRADDRNIMEEIHATFGGRLYEQGQTGNRAVAHRPYLGLHINKKDDLRELVAYFDRFPLRSKKQRDFRIWRRAVEVYLETGRAHPLLPLLKSELGKVRVYQEMFEQAPMRGERT